jgi:hypothetical protein
MSESTPRQFRPPLYYGDGSAPGQERADAARQRPKGADETGWDAYRKWLSTVGQRERPARTPIDRSVYSWKGYHNWADRVKQQWKNNDEG